MPREINLALLQFMRECGVPTSGTNVLYYAELMSDWRAKGMTVSEALTQHCDDCHDEMIIHPNALWRFRVTAIRCPKCQKKMLDAGYTLYEARYVC